MTIKELLDMLSEFPSDLQVVLSRDAEGNGYSPLSGYTIAQYIPETDYSGEIVTEEDGEEYGYEEDNCVALFPMN